MNKYENVVLVDPKLDEEAVSKLIDRFTKMINKHGKVFSVENTGLKELAYEIQKNKEAYYVILTFESDPNFIEELQRNYRIADEVLKFLVVRLEDVVLKEKAEAKVTTKTEEKEKTKSVEVEEEKVEVEEETETEEQEEQLVEEEKVEVETETEVEAEETKTEKEKK